MADLKDGRPHSNIGSIVYDIRFEIEWSPNDQHISAMIGEGSTKPSCVAQVVYRYFS